MSIRATKPRATAFENCRVREAGDLWRLHFETGHWRADFLIDRMTGSGRQRPVAASGSSRWLGLVAASLARPCFLSPNVKFRGTADSRQRNWPTSGIGARRHSPANSERLQTVLSGSSVAAFQGQQIAGGSSSALGNADAPATPSPHWKRPPGDDFRSRQTAPLRSVFGQTAIECAVNTSRGGGLGPLWSPEPPANCSSMLEPNCNLIL